MTRVVSLDGIYHDKGDYRTRKKPKNTSAYPDSSAKDLKPKGKRGKKQVTFGYKGVAH
jgi:hypothetical protein